MKYPSPVPLCESHTHTHTHRRWVPILNVWIFCVDAAAWYHMNSSIRGWAALTFLFHIFICDGGDGDGDVRWMAWERVVFSFYCYFLALHRLHFSLFATLIYTDSFRYHFFLSCVPFYFCHDYFHYRFSLLRFSKISAQTNAPFFYFFAAYNFAFFSRVCVCYCCFLFVSPLHAAFKF